MTWLRLLTFAVAGCSVALCVITLIVNRRTQRLLAQVQANLVWTQMLIELWQRQRQHERAVGNGE